MGLLGEHGEQLDKSAPPSTILECSGEYAFSEMTAAAAALQVLHFTMCTLLSHLPSHLSHYLPWLQEYARVFVSIRTSLPTVSSFQNPSYSWRRMSPANPTQPSSAAPDKGTSVAPLEHVHEASY